MPLHHQDSPRDPLAGGGDVKVTDLGSDHRLIEHGVEQLAHGALVCPDCSMPVRIERALDVAASLECGFCAAEAPARDYLVRDVFDTRANEVLLIARIG
ncbi:MAG TPA: hypothetical protein VKA36_08695 [Solirubrobacterales bacterium]|nr:hypothetical protein [Solirubrobacterales bacterium]